MRVHHRYLSVTDVQRELGLTAGQVQQLIGSRRLPAFRILGQWRIERELLERMVDELYEESATDGREVTDAHDDPLPLLPAQRPSPEMLTGLTGQQQRILELIGQGLSNAEIADTLTVEISTVKSHVSRILQRCALRNREQLIVLAWQSGLMSDDAPDGVTEPAAT